MMDKEYDQINTLLKIFLRKYNYERELGLYSHRWPRFTKVPIKYYSTHGSQIKDELIEKAIEQGEVPSTIIPVFLGVWADFHKTPEKYNSKEKIDELIKTSCVNNKLKDNNLIKKISEFLLDYLLNKDLIS